MTLLTIALAPVLIILIYIYVRDKYEREPVGLLLIGLFAGAIITIPIILVEKMLAIPVQDITGLSSAAYHAFIIAALTEEGFKFMALLLIFWRHHEFDEHFDGIVYAVFVSLGFAAVENVLYVYPSGMETGILRALTAVPAHALFGITMGYYLGLARFLPGENWILLLKAFFYPFLLHGIYNFLLLSSHPVLLLLFIPYLIFLWRSGSKKMKQLATRPYSNPS